MNIVQTCEKALIRSSVYFIVTQPRYWSLRVFFFINIGAYSLYIEFVCFHYLNHFFFKLCFKVIPMADTSFFSSQFVLGDSNHGDHVLPFSIILGVFTHDDHISILSIVSLDFCHCNIILSIISFIHGSFGFLLLRLKWMKFNKWMNFTTKQELNSRQTWIICV